MNPTLFTTHPARPGSPRSHPLAGYLAGAIGTAALCNVPQAEAAVTSVTFGFGSSFDNSYGAHDISVGPGFGTIRGYSSGAPGGSTFFGANKNFGIGSVYINSSSYGPNYGTPAFFNTGATIGAGGNGNLGSAFFRYHNNPINFDLSVAGDFSNQNIAFKTNTGNWGWANINWNFSAQQMTVNSAYIESVAGNTISVGNVAAVPEPSRALLALAGVAGVALRRRRKLAA